MLKRFSAAVALCVAVAVAGCGGSHAVQSATGSVHPQGWGGTPNGIVPPAPLPTAIPTATMFDAITVAPIPPNPFSVAGYTAGAWPDYLALRRAFPQAHAVSIAIQAGYRADCLDVEPGDASPGQAGAWAVADMRAGFAHPCLYSDLSEMPAVQASLRSSLGSGWRARVFLWLAWYRNVPGLVAGYDAVQYTDTCLGRNLDCSTVSLNFLSIAQPPYVPPAPLPVCFHKRETAAACAAARAKIASDQRAAASSGRALAVKNRVLTAYKCVLPYRRGVCVRNGQAASVFRQRARFFTQAAARLEAAN